ncbi:MAG TPA: hypothetical protein VFI47_02105 [Acidimicrobiales bacterium]|nr:hypothetical protein [Acidimicrobiales bacterium]
MVVAVALTLALAGGGCGGGKSAAPDNDDLPDTAETVPPSTSSPVTTTEDAVREAYEAYVAMVNRITTTTVDPDDPELATRMVDPILSASRRNLTTWRTEGQVWVAGDVSRFDIEAVEIDGDTAYLTVCSVGNDALVPVGTDDVELPPVAAVRDKVTLIRHGEGWLVRNVDPLGTWEGDDECGE